MPQMPRTATWHLPVPDLETKEYWDAAREGRLFIKECRSCGEAFFYPRTYCPKCWSSDTAWKESTGLGRVYTFTVVHQNDLPPFKDRVPYVVALVDLEEGPRLMTNIVDCEPDDVAVGAPVRVRFDEVTEGVRLPFFLLAGS